MKGITLLTDEKSKKQYLQIDIQTVQKFDDEKLEELYDVLISSLREGQSTTSIDSIEKKLKKAGKL